MSFKIRLFSKLLLIAALYSSITSCTQINIEGKAAPEFTIEKLTGGTISSADLQGKAVMLYWFSGW